MSQDAKGLIFLSSENAIITETLNAALAPEEPRREPMELKIADFDDSEYHLHISPDNKNKLIISVKMRCIKEILPMGAKATVDALYGKILENTPQSGFDLSFGINLDNLPYPKPELIKNVSELRKNLLGAPIKRMFEALNAGNQATLKPMLIPYREKEILLLSPGSDRILVNFSVVFEDETDRAIAQVFLQEFCDAPKKVNGAPTITFSKDPNPEVSKAAGFKEQSNTVGYIQFQILKSHVAGNKLDGLATQLVGFRSYLHYVCFFCYYYYYYLYSILTYIYIFHAIYKK